MSRPGSPQPEWMATLRVGDVLTNGRSYRVVREVSRWHRVNRRTVAGEGPLKCVAFTIKHCSWTGRCYTILCASDLLQRGFRPAGVRVKLDKPWDAAILHEITKCAEPASLRCCDVRGVA